MLESREEVGMFGVTNANRYDNYEVFMQDYLEGKLNNFDEDLAWSESPEQYAKYLQVIAYWWPTAKKWERTTNILEQKNGKDTIVFLLDRELKLQFKTRRVDYGDFLIEYRHDWFNGHRSPGWIEKNDQIDYLFYLVPGKAFRIEWTNLQNVWAINRNEWIEKFDIPPARNEEYFTRNVAIQWKTLTDAGVIVDGIKLIENQLSLL